MNQPVREETMPVRRSWRSLAVAILGGLGFVLVGCLMLVLPPPANSVLPWTKALQSVVGVLAILFGSVGLGAAYWLANGPGINEPTEHREDRHAS